MTEKERIEGARRARAAMAYARVNKQAVARALNTSPSTVGRILDGTRPETDHDELWKIADLCTLPRDWFTADLSRLAEIVPAGEPTFGSPQELRDRMVRESEAHVERVRRRTGAGVKGKRGPQRKARES